MMKNNEARVHCRNHVLLLETFRLFPSSFPRNRLFLTRVYTRWLVVALNSSCERFPVARFIRWPFAMVGFTIPREILV